MSGTKAQIQFHRRSRYEDILELVNDNEEALRPFPNRDAVCIRQVMVRII